MGPRDDQVPKSCIMKSYTLSSNRPASQCASLLPAQLSLKFSMFPTGWGVKNSFEPGTLVKKPQGQPVGAHH